VSSPWFLPLDPGVTPSFRRIYEKSIVIEGDGHVNRGANGPP